MWLYGAKSKPEDDIPISPTHSHLFKKAAGKPILVTLPLENVVESVDRYGLPGAHGRDDHRRTVGQTHPSTGNIRPETPRSAVTVFGCERAV